VSSSHYAVGFKHRIKRRIALTSIYGLTQNTIGSAGILKYSVNTEQLIEAGNAAREQNDPEAALRSYAQALTQDRNSASAFNNYGNVLREIGEPASGIPFLERAIQLAPDAATPNFNLAVARLLMGDYARGWPQYEHRWQFEHLAGTLPTHAQPRWTGQPLKDKTILVIQEQGLGDVIQFVRFVFGLHSAGGRVILQVNDNLAPLFAGSPVIHQIIDVADTPTEFDYWTPIMSIPGIQGVTLQNLPHQLQYLAARTDLARAWQDLLGPKRQLRVGMCWSGRPDSWINRHKGMPFDVALALIKRNPQMEWHNLQAECTTQQTEILEATGVQCHAGRIRNFGDTAALVHHLDVVITVDTAVAHLAGALGRPTWIPLNWYGTDWRWGLGQDSTPWYPSARLFRQPSLGDWSSVMDRIHQYLSWFKV
jgi:tetratricopeptide (TPR) repeat protein